MSTAFVATPSPMGDKVIIIVPKVFHPDVKPLLKTQIAIAVRDALDKQKATEFKYIGSVSPMGNQFIVYVPKRYHKDVKPLIGKKTAVYLKEAL